MVSKKENRSIFIDKEAIATLSMVKEGLLSPIDKLMNQSTANKVDITQEYKGASFPFSFILAPSGKNNHQVLKSATKGEILNIICTQTRRKVGEIIVNSTFTIDPIKRAKNIFATYDLDHPGIKDVLLRLGTIAVEGEYEVDFVDIKETLVSLNEKIKSTNANKVTAMMIAAKPLHRAHERVIRLALERSDLLVLFLLKPYKKDLFSYELRKKTVDEFIQKYLPNGKVIVVPFENTYLFGGNNETILNAIVAQNYGCNSIILGENHAGLGLYYENSVTKSIFDRTKGIKLDVDIVKEYVYCNECTTMVSNESCPHGDHHHIHYRADSISELLKTGIIPPAVLVRKEVSSIILSDIFPQRFKNLQALYNDILPLSGVVEEHSEREFYSELIKLYQTTSLT
jgi:sulfate adenylyltransferase